MLPDPKYTGPPVKRQNSDQTAKSTKRSLHSRPAPAPLTSWLRMPTQAANPRLQDLVSSWPVGVASAAPHKRSIEEFKAMRLAPAFQTLRFGLCSAASSRPSMTSEDRRLAESFVNSCPNRKAAQHRRPDSKAQIAGQLQTGKRHGPGRHPMCRVVSSQLCVTRIKLAHNIVLVHLPCSSTR